MSLDSSIRNKKLKKNENKKVYEESQQCVKKCITWICDREKKTFKIIFI